MYRPSRSACRCAVYVDDGYSLLNFNSLTEASRITSCVEETHITITDGQFTRLLFNLMRAVIFTQAWGQFVITGGAFQSHKRLINKSPVYLPEIDTVLSVNEYTRFEK